MGTAQHVHPTGLLTFQYNLWAACLTSSTPSLSLYSSLLCSVPSFSYFLGAAICFSADVRPKLTLLRTLIPFTHTRTDTHSCTSTPIHTHPSHTHTGTPRTYSRTSCCLPSIFAYIFINFLLGGSLVAPLLSPPSLCLFCGCWRQIVCLFLGFLCDSGQSQQSVSRRPLNAFSFNALCVYLAWQVHNCHYAYAVWSRGRMAFLECTFAQYAYAEINTRSMVRVCVCVCR